MLWLEWTSSFLQSQRQHLTCNPELWKLQRRRVSSCLSPGCKAYGSVYINSGYNQSMKGYLHRDVRHRSVEIPGVYKMMLAAGIPDIQVGSTEILGAPGKVNWDISLQYVSEFLSEQSLCHGRMHITFLFIFCTLTDDGPIYWRTGAHSFPSKSSVALAMSPTRLRNISRISSRSPRASCMAISPFNNGCTK